VVMPTLAGNRLISMNPSVNLVRAVARGGFAPATQGHPRPFGMPPFAHALSDEEIARILTYLRSAWGHRAAPVSAYDVARGRGAGDD
jgi:mono/diheme cytochrome c family protein